MQVVWSRTALDNLATIRSYIADHNPPAAAMIAARLLEAGNALQDFPNRGKSTGIDGIQELIITGTPFLLVYRVTDTAVEILSVWHSAQDRL
jgi:addiction module RelE/StbE family toxin